MVHTLSLLAAGASLIIPLVQSRATPNRLPHLKRIAQTISDSTTKWEQACDTAGGGDQCNTISVAAFSTLLAAPGPCEQQNAGDQMIDLAKTLNNNAAMISLAQIFVQQPRNSPDSLSVLYCQEAPKNEELNGLFQCQFQGVNPKVFTGNVAVGQPGTIPLGHSSPLDPAGSCAANPSGGIADGTQLVDITQDPGVSGSSKVIDSPSSVVNNSSSASSTTSTAAEPTSTDGSNCSDNSDTSDDSTDPSTGGSDTSSGTTGSSDFHLQNGKDAQALNAQFATLSASSTCNTGDEACVGGNFAQCVGGQFVTTPCGGGLGCFALPLVNKPGTSITCDTQTDAIARIAATGATGGLTG